MNLEDWFGDPGHTVTRSHMMITETKLAGRRQMVTPELKLMKKVTADKEGAGPQLPRIVAEKPLDIERRRFYVSSVDIEAHGHMGSCPGYALLIAGRSDKTM